MIATTDYGPFAPVVGYAAAIIAAGTAIGVTWRGALAKWKPPEEDLPNAAQKVVLLICGIQMVIVWGLAAPDTASRILITAAIGAGICFAVFLSYSAMIGKYTFVKRVAVSPKEEREVRLLGGRKLLPEAAAIMKKKKIVSIQELLEGAAYDPDKLWDRHDRAIVKTWLVALFVLMLVAGTLALTAAGFAAQVILTGKPAASVIRTQESPGLNDSTNAPAEAHPATNPPAKIASADYNNIASALRGIIDLESHHQRRIPDLLEREDWDGLVEDARSLGPEVQRLQALLDGFPSDFVVSRLATFRQLKFDLARRMEIINRTLSGRPFADGEWEPLRQEYVVMIGRLESFERDFASYLQSAKK